jgi:ATP-dependent Clp protease ATP-binding subunit ClpC
MKEMLRKEVERTFRPEFINRVDEIIVFRSLTREDLVTIIDYEVRKVYKRLREHNLELSLDEAAKEFLITKGYNPDFGARPLRRAIEQLVEDPLSEAILRGEYKGCSKINVSTKDDHLFFEGLPATGAPADATAGPAAGTASPAEKAPGKPELAGTTGMNDAT